MTMPRPSQDQSESFPRFSRRKTVQLAAFLAGGSIAITTDRQAIGQVATPVATPADAGIEVLFVQGFASSTLGPGSEPGTLTLVLEGGTGQTMYFSDRPNRVVGTIETGRFVTVFRDETASDPANAALVAQVDATNEVTYVLELLDMEYDAATGRLTYTVRLLTEPGAIDMQFDEAPQQAVDSPVSHGASQMFIDPGGLMQLVAYGAQDVDDDTGD